MKINTEKMKILAFEGKDTWRVKSVVNNKMMEQVLNFNYLGYNIGSSKYDTDMKLKIRH
jgi:hypothetical protein